MEREEKFSFYDFDIRSPIELARVGGRHNRPKGEV